MLIVLYVLPGKKKKKIKQDGSHDNQFACGSLIEFVVIIKVNLCGLLGLPFVVHLGGRDLVNLLGLVPHGA